MAQHRDRPIQPKSSAQADGNTPRSPDKKPSPYTDLAQEIRREIDRAIG